MYTTKKIQKNRLREKKKNKFKKISVFHYMNWHTLMSFHPKKGYERVNFLTKKMRTFFCTTITTVALRQIKARARTWISGHVFPILICFFWTPNLSPITGVISFKRCFLLKNWGPHFAKKKIITLQFKLFYNIAE